MNQKISIEISSSAWINPANNYMIIDPAQKAFFPADCFIARGTGKANAHLIDSKGITLHYEGASVPVKVFMEERAGGQFRPSVRGAIRDFYAQTSAKVGDVIEFTRLRDREYQVALMVGAR